MEQNCQDRLCSFRLNRAHTITWNICIEKRKITTKCVIPAITVFSADSTAILPPLLYLYLWYSILAIGHPLKCCTNFRHWLTVLLFLLLCLCSFLLTFLQFRLGFLFPPNVFRLAVILFLFFSVH